MFRQMCGPPFRATMYLSTQYCTPRQQCVVHQIQQSLHSLIVPFSTALAKAIVPHPVHH